MISVDLLDEDNYLSELEKTEIQELLNFAYDHLKEEGQAEVSVSFVSNEEIRAINRDYRDKHSVTDLLFFDLVEYQINIVHEVAPRTLRAIIVSTGRARAQAVDYGHSFCRDLLFLSLNGVLHLLGYAHMETDA